MTIEYLVIGLAWLLALNIALFLVLLILTKWKDLHRGDGGEDWIPEPDDPRWKEGVPVGTHRRG